jgi:transmembrane sensor
VRITIKSHILENQKHIKSLFSKYLNDTCSAEEVNELLNYLELQNQEESLKKMIQSHMESEPVRFAVNEKQVEAALLEVRDNLLAKINIPEPASIKIRRLVFYKMAAAAVVLLILSVGLYFYGNRYLTTDKDFNALNKVNDIAPGKNTATLILGNGKAVALSEAKTGLVVEAARLKYNDGTAVGVGEPKIDNATQTIVTPRGGTYQITLSDGTKVWLNAESSLTYSADLTKDDERRVKLVGEGYFEVAKDKNHPFIVESKGQEVKVLGTHFNINSYADEGVVKTTLLEGSVKVTSFRMSGTVILSPNQQASVTNSSNINVTEVNAENVIAWKNGLFMFNDEPLVEVMQKISRWYGVKVTISDPELYQKTVYGTIDRYSNVSKVLSMLEKTKEMQFEIVGNTINVKRK